MTDDLDDLIRRRAATVEPGPAPGLEPDALWSAGRQRRRRRRGALAGAGTLLAAALAGGVTASALGDNDSARGPAVAATPSGSPSPQTSSATPGPSAPPTPSPADTSGLAGPLADAIQVLSNSAHHIYVDPRAPGQHVIDTAQTTQDIGTADIKLAVLPADALATHQTPAQLAAEIGSRLGDKTAVIMVIVGQQPGAAAGSLTGITAGQAESVLTTAQAAHDGPFTLANVQATLDDAIAVYVAQLTGHSNATQGVLGVSPYSATPTIPHGEPAQRVVGDCIKPQLEPTIIVVTCGDGGTSAIDLKYATYGPETATGTGTLAQNDCKPDCARGRDIDTPMTFVLDKLETYDGHPTFTRLRVTYASGHTGLNGEREDTFSLYVPPAVPVN